MSSDASRPLLITIIAILYLLEAIIYILAGVAVVFVGVSIDLGEIGGILGGSILVVGIITLLIAIGFFMGWKIIWYVAVILKIITVILEIVGLVGSAYLLLSDFAALLAVLIPLAIDILLLYYMFRPNVKAFFGVGSSA
jgi:hypothetical protein